MMANFDTHYFHDVCIYALYGSAVLATFVIVERSVYYVFLNLRTGSLGAAVRGSKKVNPEAIKRILKRRDAVSRNVAEYVGALSDPAFPRSRLEDVSGATYLNASSRLASRLWLLDTIITAAPLLGLLGTILGIMDTFNALSAGGISDPAAVSRGIAAALFATAVGIGVALYGVLGYNLLQRFSDYITDRMKQVFLLADGVADQVRDTGQARAESSPSIAAARTAA